MDLIRDWMETLTEEQHRSVSRAFDLLADSGPALKRPMVGEVLNSQIKNLKELRPSSAGGQVMRVLFVFDTQRCAVALVGGVKGDRKGSGRDPWKKWYRDAIKTAEARYAGHLDTL